LQGETIHWAKLSEDDIPQILERLAAGVLIKKVAEEFRVSRSLITAIRQGKVWHHLNLAAAYGPMRREESYPQMVLSTEDVADIRARVAAGEMQKTVADAYGISRSYTSALVNHKARTDE
jgi:DNA-binding XRE family transcriptional regulator